MLPRVAVALLLALTASLAPAAAAPLGTPVAAGAVSVTAFDCQDVGGAWIFQNGEFFGTLGSGRFTYAVFVGEGTARGVPGTCLFRGLGALVVVL